MPTIQRLGAAVGIICKAPVPGASKTRLIPVLGEEGAAELAGAFLRDVAAAIERVPACCHRMGYAVYAPEGSEARIRPCLPPDFRLICRRGATLEHVLLGSTRQLLGDGHDVVVLVNGDSPTLPPLTIASAIAALRREGDRVVLGPASDGGYYLIGLKTPHAALFRDIPWSTPAVLGTTLDRARSVGLTAELLPGWYDIDEIETLSVLIDEIAGGTLPFDHGGLQGGPACSTRAFLAARPWLRGRCQEMAGGRAG
jgi:rSAM/selenodomain-associated transferase 1